MHTGRISLNFSLLLMGSERWEPLQEAMKWSLVVVDKNPIMAQPAHTALNSNAKWGELTRPTTLSSIKGICPLAFNEGLGIMLDSLLTLDPQIRAVTRIALFHIFPSTTILSQLELRGKFIFSPANFNYLSKKWKCPLIGWKGWDENSTSYRKTLLGGNNELVENPKFTSKNNLDWKCSSNPSPHNACVCHLPVGPLQFTPCGSRGGWESVA